jgi:hypothetical protein
VVNVACECPVAGLIGGPDEWAGVTARRPEDSGKARVNECLQLRDNIMSAYRVIRESLEGIASVDIAR